MNHGLKIFFLLFDMAFSLFSADANHQSASSVGNLGASTSIAHGAVSHLLAEETTATAADERGAGHFNLAASAPPSQTGGGQVPKSRVSTNC